MTKTKHVVWWGQVQSGKTREYIDFIDRFIKENKTSLVVVLTSEKSKLHRQNVSRIKANLEKKPFVKISEKLEQLGENNLRSSITPGAKQNGLSIILILMKNVHWMNKLLKYVDNNVTKLRDFSLLVIDDESDYYTNSQNILEDVRQRDDSSAQIREQIKRLIDSSIFTAKEYHSVSATPFIRFGNKEQSQALWVLQPNNEYFGHWKFLSSKCFELIQSNKKERYAGLDAAVKFYILSSSGEKSEAIRKDFLLNPGRLVNQTSRKGKQTVDELFEIVKSEPSLISLRPDFIKMTGDENDEDFDQKSETCRIIVGGAIVSRGITFNLNTMWLNSANNEVVKSVNLSAVLQKARWCGYYNENLQKKLSDLRNPKIYIGKSDYETYLYASALELLLRTRLLYAGKKISKDRVGKPSVYQVDNFLLIKDCVVKINSDAENHADVAKFTNQSEINYPFCFSASLQWMESKEEIVRNCMNEDLIEILSKLTGYQNRSSLEKTSNFFHIDLGETTLVCLRRPSIRGVSTSEPLFFPMFEPLQLVERIKANTRLCNGKNCLIISCKIRDSQGEIGRGFFPILVDFNKAD